ncbi:hypothetical protein ANN_13399, partial [Periplaneta americana]
MESLWYPPPLYFIETDQKEEKKLAGSQAKKKLPIEGCTDRESKRKKYSRQRKISDDRRQHASKNPGLTVLRTVADILAGKTPEHECAVPLHLIPTFKYALVSSIDVERSFSAYKMVLSEKRCSFSMENLEKVLVVYSGSNYGHTRPVYSRRENLSSDDGSSNHPSDSDTVLWQSHTPFHNVSDAARLAKYFISQHISTTKHKNALSKSTGKRISFLPTVIATSSRKSQFAFDLCKAFLAAEIPLWKVQGCGPSA